jgi:nucleotide-binding universal stress UspA family protein
MKILFATDGSEHASAALDFLLRFPFPRDTSITIITVVDDMPMIQAKLDTLDEDQAEALQSVNRALQVDAEQLVAGVGDRLRADGWSGEALIRGGAPAKEILQAADDIDADLIVLGSHGMGGVKRFLLGSVSDRVLEYASCSVLIVKTPATAVPAMSAEMGANTSFKVMLAYDGSKASRLAMETCAGLPLGKESEIRVVSVMPLVTAYRQDVRQHINRIWLRKKQVMQDELEETVRSLRWTTPNVFTELREGSSIQNEILTAAEEADSDLIMIGCKDRGTIKRLLLGSVTHRLARYAACTVWAVRKGLEKE